MKKGKLSLFIAITMVIGSLLFANVYAGSANAMYVFSGSIIDRGTPDTDDDVFELKVNIKNVRASAGGIGLDYDKSKLVLTSFDEGTGVAKLESLTQVSEQEGYYIFAWYGTNGTINSTDSEKTIATFTFDMKDGIDHKSFNSDTFKVKPFIGENEEIWNEDEQKYIIFNHVPEMNCASVQYTYTGADCYAVNTTVTGQQDATISIEGFTETWTTDENGFVQINLPDGSHVMTVSKAGYHDVQKNITIDGENQDITLTMQKAEYDIIKNATNGTINGEDTVIHGEVYTFTLSADAAYNMAEPVITVGGIIITPSESQGTYTIAGEDVTGDITITVTFQGSKVAGKIIFAGAAGAQVKFASDENGEFITTTDSEGNFERLVRSGTYTISVAKDRHLNYTITGVQINDEGLTFTKNITLIPGDASEDGLEVSMMDLAHVVTGFDEYKQNADINEDTYISIEDISYVLTSYGKEAVTQTYEQFNQ